MRHTLLLIVILMLGATLRFWGLGYDLPNVYTIDEPLIMNKAIRVADGYLRHGTILRGSLPHYIIGGAIKVASLMFPNIKGDYQTLTDSYMHDKTIFYMIGRTVNALLGVTEILLLFFLASLSFDVSVALLASFFLSISPLAINSAHAISPDTGLSSSMLLTISIGILASKRRSNELFLLAGFLSGLSAGQKFPGIVSLLFVILLFYLKEQSGKRRASDRVFYIVLIILFSIIAYTLSYPFIFGEFSKFIAEWRFENSSVLLWNRPAHYDFGILWRIQQSLLWLRMWGGTFIFYLSAAGITYAFKKRQPIVGALSGFSLLFFLINAVPVKMHEFRYIPLIPYMCLFAALVCEYLRSRLFISLPRLYGTLMLVTFVSIAPFIKSVFLARSYASPSIQSLELSCVTSNNIDESMILRDPYTSDMSDFTLDWITRHYSPIGERYIHTTPMTDIHKYTYAIVNDEFAKWYYFWEQYQPELHKIADAYRYLNDHTNKIVELMPKITNINEEDLDFLLHADRWIFDQVRGPKITIYKLQ